MRLATKQWTFLVLLGVSLAGMVGLSLWRMSVELTDAQARHLATRLANQAFARETLLSAADRPIPTIVLRPESWRVAEKRGERWHFRFDPPAGPEATVSFDAHGRGAEVHVSYAPTR